MRSRNPTWHIVYELYLKMSKQDRLRREIVIEQNGRSEAHVREPSAVSLIGHIAIVSGYCKDG